MRPRRATIPATRPHSGALKKRIGTRCKIVSPILSETKAHSGTLKRRITSWNGLPARSFSLVAIIIRDSKGMTGRPPGVREPPVRAKTFVNVGHDVTAIGPKSKGARRFLSRPATLNPVGAAGR